ncbi:subtilase [Sarocladium strictum]
MRSSSLYWSLLFVSGSAAFAPEDELAEPIPLGYIIEYERGSLAKRQEEIAGIQGIDVERTFESDIFSGVAVSTDEYNIDTLGTFPGVVNVWLNEYISLPPVEEHGRADGGSLNYTTHISTGVSKLHEAGIFGKGVKVGVIDTGILYDHRALGEGYGPGFKVANGYDFVGDGDWPLTPIAPDDDPTDTRGHGTHVAGIIAGKTDFWQGVAPEATLYAYKVFSTQPSTSTAVLIDSFIRAYEDGCDIITASIGGANGWSTNAWAEVASRLVELGVFVSISAGNSGANGPFYGSSGSSGKNVIAVASIETELFPLSPFGATFTTDGDSNTVRIGYLPSTSYFPPSVKDWPIKPVSLNTAATADGCTALPSDVSFEGSIALVRRGGCTFAEKQAILEARGAKYVLVYTNESPLTTPATESTKSLLAMIAADSGEAIIEAIAAGGSVKADFSLNPEEIVAVPHVTAGKPSIFTSWAGTWDLQMKPDVAAPGGQIFSAWSDGGYNVISGTSMACPYIAGVAALWISVHGGRDKLGVGFAKELGQRIVSSGKAVPWSDGTATNFGYSAPVAQVGNGLVDAWKVLQYDTRLEFERFALNDTRYFKRYHDVSVFNDGDEEVSYTWSVEHGAGVEAIGWLPNDKGAGRRIKKFAQLRPQTLEAKVSLPNSFKLKPGQSRKITVNFDNPDKITPAWNVSGLPVYGGKVSLSGSNGERLSVPFYGVGADLRAQLNPLTETGYPTSVSGPANVSITSDSSYSFDLSLAKQDYPRIYNKLLWGSRQIRWDIFEAGWREREWKYPPVAGENKYVGPVAGWYGNADAIFNPARDNADATVTFPLVNSVRNVDDRDAFAWLGKLGNGTNIAKGKYEMRFAVLKPFGRPEAADNWEVYRTPQIEVV